MTQVHGARVVACRPATPPGRTGHRSRCVPRPGRGGRPGVRPARTALCVLTADCGAAGPGQPRGRVRRRARRLAGPGGRRGRGGRGRPCGTWGRPRSSGALGPCIHAGCYEFAEPDLDAVAAAYGDAVRGATTDRARRPSTWPAGVAAALAAAGGRTDRRRRRVHGVRRRVVLPPGPGRRRPPGPGGVVDGRGRGR